MDESNRQSGLNFPFCIKHISRSAWRVCESHPYFRTLGFRKSSSLADKYTETGHLDQRFAFLAWNLLLPSARTVADDWTAASYVLQNPVLVCSGWSGLIGSPASVVIRSLLLPFDVNRKNLSIGSHIFNKQDISYVACKIRSEHSLSYHDFSHHKD